MSRLFGPLRQMGYVVPDVEAAMRHWIEVCGVGPWFYAERLPLASFSYGGKRYDDIHLSIALANSGEMQIELIQQRSDHPSMGRDFLAVNPRGGLQHWSSWPENYDELYDRALAKRLHRRSGGRRAARPVRVFPQRGPSRHGHRDVARHAGAPAHLRCGARGGRGMGRQGSDPHRLAHIRRHRGSSARRAARPRSLARSVSGRRVSQPATTACARRCSTSRSAGSRSVPAMSA
jgi:hypothetical protein